MITIHRADDVFSVDAEQTQRYDEAHSLCDCGYCRNYYAQIKGKLPKLDAFLREFGVDMAKPDEISSVETDDSIDYIRVDYTVCGSVQVMGQGTIHIEDALLLETAITDGFASPNEQTGTYFTISVMGIELPWVLDEPFPKSMKRR